ncbi:MAG: RidA family protein [Phycisphaeraceae bacterium]
MELREKLGELGIELPEVPVAVAEYVPAVRCGQDVFVSGQLPLREGHLVAEGVVPSEVSLDEARQAAEQATLNAIAAADQALEGDWSRFERVARLAVYVASDADFHLQHKVANGASELLGRIFGEAGRHARAAVGASALPLRAPVEVELLLRLRTS